MISFAVCLGTEIDFASIREASVGEPKAGATARPPTQVQSSQLPEQPTEEHRFQRKHSKVICASYLCRGPSPRARWELLVTKKAQAKEGWGKNGEWGVLWGQQMFLS